MFDKPTADVGLDTLRLLLGTVHRHPFLVELAGETLIGPAGAAEIAAHAAALRSEPHGGWVVVRGVPPQLVFDYQRLRTYVGPYLSVPLTLLSAVHTVGDEIVAIVYVDAAPRGFEVMARDAIFADEVMFRVGDVFVRHAGRTERWTPLQANNLVDRIRAEARGEAAPPKPERPRRERREKPAYDPAAVDALVEAAGDDVVAAYAAGALAVRLRRWSAVRAAAVRQGPPDTIARAHQLVRGGATYRPDGADDNAVLDSLCQLDVFAALVALGSGGRCEAGFARYWAQRARAAFKAVVSDPDARAAIFPADDARLAEALRELDSAAVVEGSDSGGWPGIGDAAVEALFAREPG